ncbi:methionyl-tRNA formyltransferase [Seongchinamella sediminis]|uniref:Methionyl-tRNA formyltransferase n=1 Tax=Seongchinamella sediminis TaxID=2283635 RepID=A0A3L7DWZ1_9GAMM|nr:methionyl-tRNA formyltransferase [Seongchinamella sediminis]RLQ22088.1 methionyl-tRNA formyltransferase [Seongchinamella sediminis]
MAALKLIFAGTPAFAAIHMRALIDSEHQLIAVYTQPDRPAGRGKKLQASPVKQTAEAAGVPVYQPASLRDRDEQARLAALGADAMVVVAYGLILPPEVLAAPRLGCLNVHASLLPRWRGAAPIQRAIEAGDRETGSTIMQMDAGLDTGAMLATARCAIGAHTTAASLHDELARIGAPLLVEVLSDLPGYQAGATTQDDSQASYASKISKAEAELDWQRPAIELDRCIRAFNPFPICFTHLQGQRIKIWQARPAGSAPLPETAGTILRADRDGILVNCGSGQLAIERLQLPGGKALSAAEVVNGSAELFAAGACFSPSDVAS